MKQIDLSKRKHAAPPNEVLETRANIAAGGKLPVLKPNTKPNMKTDTKAIDELLTIEERIDETRKEMIGCETDWAKLAERALADFDTILGKKLYKGTWESYLKERFQTSKMQLSRMRETLNQFRGLNPKAQKQLSQGSNKNVTGPKANAPVVAALAKVPEAEQAKVLAEASKDGNPTAKKIEAAAKAEDADFEEVLKDKVGNDVPKKLISEWKRATEVGKDHLKKISEVRVSLKKEDAIFVEAKGAVEEADTLYGAIKKIIPHAVCPYCKGSGCKVCSKRGFVSEHFYEHSIPPEKK